MSFGKDPNQLATIGGYGASMTQQMGNATRKQPSSRNGAPFWANTFKPSTGTPDEIRVIPGSYTIQRVNEGVVYEEQLPWFECTEHYHGGLSRSVLCSAGVHRMDRNKREPCCGCEMYWEDYMIRKEREKETGNKVTKPNRVSMRSLYVFNVLDLGYFFKAPQRDENGHLKLNPQDGKPYMVWTKYVGQHQAAEANAQGAEGHWGHVMSWPLGRDHFNMLSSYSDLISKNCLSCGGHSTIVTRHWSCNNCHAVLLDPWTANMPPEKVQEFTQQPVRCGTCGTTAYPHEEHHCSNCQYPRPATIFDVNLHVKRQKDPSTQRVQLIIPQFSNPQGLPPHFADALQKLPDLAKRYAPTPYNEQLTLFQQASAHDQAQAGQTPTHQAYGAGMAPPGGYGAPPPAQGSPGEAPSYQQPGPFTPPGQFAAPGQYQAPAQQPYQNYGQPTAAQPVATGHQATVGTPQGWGNGNYGQ